MKAVQWLKELIFRQSPEGTLVIGGQHPQASTAYGKNEAKRRQHKEAIELIESHGLRVHYYLPTASSHDNEELWKALDELRNAGYIITDADGQLYGKVSTVNLSTTEKAIIRRQQFSVVKTSPISSVGETTDSNKDA